LTGTPKRFKVSIRLTAADASRRTRLPLHSGTQTRAGRWQISCSLLSLSMRAKSAAVRRIRTAVSTASERMEVRMKSILDPTFRYTSSANTDLRKTFARIRRETRRQSQATSREPVDASKKITPIFRGQRPAA
jgi:hypothetical protein